MQFLQDLLDYREPANWWQEYRGLCKNIKDVDINLYVQALPALLKKLENNYAIRDLGVALELESKNNASFGTQVFKETLETNNLKLYSTLTDVIIQIRILQLIMLRA